MSVSNMITLVLMIGSSNGSVAVLFLDVDLLLIVAFSPLGHAPHVT